MSLLSYRTPDCLEAGLDEVARGCLFGRVYAAAVIWHPDLKPEDFGAVVKDSKQYKGVNDREEAEKFIKNHVVAYGIAYVDAHEIDKINILQASIRAMHLALQDMKVNPDKLIVDGNKFKAYVDQYGEYPEFTTIERGDATYYSIAAASVLAKCEHDRWIAQLCSQYPSLDRYDLRNNKGYGSPEHLKAIEQFGITQFHRKTFGVCKTAVLNTI
jgi:ribonuclease HII